MGLFSKKQKYKKEDMPNLMMAVGMDMVGKLRGFNGIDDYFTTAVNLGYFYGFLRMQLSNLTSIQNSDEIIENSLKNLNEAVGGKIPLDNFIYIVRTNYNNSFENIKRSVKSNTIIESMAQMYLNDLYQKEIVDDTRLMVAKNNINLLYGMILKATDNMKIV
jgi:hypothetical protein